MSDTADFLERLDRIEEVLRRLAGCQSEKDWYTPAEAAKILGRAEYTVREWCRHRRIRASKRHCGRGTSKEWMIAVEELRRVQNEGLLPLSED